MPPPARAPDSAPSVDNRGMESNTPSRRELPAGLGVSAFGAFILWMVLRDDGSSRNAPLWVALVAGGAFVLAGLAMAARAVAIGPRRARWEAVSAALVAAVITGLGLIGAWIGFGPGERQSGARMDGPFLAFLPAHRTEILFRFMFGLSALFMLGLCVVVWSRLFRTLFRGARTPARAATAAVAPRWRTAGRRGSAWRRHATRGRPAGRR